MSRKKLSVNEKVAFLEVAESTGNISQTCRQYGISRSQYYEYKRRFDANGINGLSNRLPIHKTHPQKIPAAVVEKILELSLEHPAWGCAKLGRFLDSIGTHVSSPTIQKILTQNGLRTILDRALILEEKYWCENLVLSSEQLLTIEKLNPFFTTMHHCSDRPGQLLIQDFFLIGTFKNIGKLYIQTVVDTFSFYGFASFNTAKSSELAVTLLKNEVFPFYNKLRLKIDTIETTSNKCFQGTEIHPYRLCLFLNNITHRAIEVKRGARNVFTEKLYQILLDEFFSNVINSEKNYSLPGFSNELSKWMLYYNNMRTQNEYPNKDLSPIQRINNYLEKPRVLPSSD